MDYITLFRRNALTGEEHMGPAGPDGGYYNGTYYPPMSRKATYTDTVEVRLYVAENYVSERRYMAHYKWSFALKRLARTFYWDATTFTLDKKGRFTVYLRRRGAIYNTTFNPYVLEMLNSETKAAMCQVFNLRHEDEYKVRIINERRPYLRLFKEYNIEDARTLKTDPKTYLKKRIGKKNFNKRYLKVFGFMAPKLEFANWNYWLDAVVEMNKYFPVEWMLDYIDSIDVERHPVIPRPVGDITGVIEWIGKKRTFKALIEAYIWYVTDSFGMWRDLRANDIEFPKPKCNDADSWHRYHDELAAAHRKMSVQDRKIEQISSAQRIDGDTIPDTNYVIDTAKTTYQMIDWSSVMNNCISNYTERAARGLGLYLAVKDSDKIIANAEINEHGQLVQLLGPHNKALSKDNYFKIVNYLVARMVITDVKYPTWGAPGNEHGGF